MLNPHSYISLHLYVDLFTFFGTTFHQSHEEKSFIGWMRESNILFTQEEYHYRNGIWITNQRMVQEQNMANVGFSLGMNHLSHLTSSEYKTMLCFKTSIKNRLVKRIDTVAIEEIDWRQKGIVNCMKN